MKCPYCHGTGKKDIETGLNCPKCWGKGEAEITNEEWIRLCPTHELIRILMSVAEGGAMRKESARDFCDEAQRWSLWLKEIHNDNA